MTQASLPTRWASSRIAALIAYASIAISAHSQAKPITLNYAFDDAERLYNISWCAWAGKHDLLLADPGSGGFVKLDAATDKRSPLGDAVTIENAIHGAGGPQLMELPPPQAVSPDGRFLAFVLDTRLFIADTGSNGVVQAASARNSIKNVQFSPDATAVAFVKDNDLYSYVLDSKKVNRLTSDGKSNLLNGVLTWVYWEEIYNHHDQAFWWSPDSKDIAYLRTDESNVPPSLIVDIKPQYPAILSQCYPKPGNPNPLVNVGIVPAAGGAPVLLNPLKSQDGYVVGAKWATKGNEGPYFLYQTMNREQTKVSVMGVPEADISSAPQTFFSEENPKFIDVNDDFDFVNGGKGLIVGSARSGYEQLYRVDPAVSDQEPKLITKGAWQILPAEMFDPTTVTFVDRDQNWIYLDGDKDSVQERALYRVHDDGSGLERVTKEKGTHVATFSPDGQFFVDVRSSRDTPPTQELRRADGAIVETLDKPSLDILSGVLLSPEKYVEIPTRDGFKLPATIRKPRTMTPGKKYPAIIQIYGGPEAPTVAEEWNYDWAEDQLLADSGFIVVHVDNRSSTVINRHLADAIRGHFYGGSERNDFVDAALWLKSQPDVDPNRVGIMGWSGGGGNVLNCMCRSTEFKAGMAGAPYVDPMLYDTFYSEHLFGLPKEDPQAYEDAAVWKDAKNLHGKLLMMWGTGDDNVHNQQELKFVDELIAAGKTVQIMVFPMRKHDLGDTPAEKMRTQTYLDFFKANL